MSTTAESLRPTRTPHGCDPDRQAEDMRTLRRLSGEGFNGAHELGELLLALDQYPTLCRHDMAVATGRDELEIARIIEEFRSAEIRCKRNATAEHLRRHSMTR